MRIDHAGYVGQHNLVFLQPAEKWLDGHTLGNGDIGAMKFGPPGEVRFGVCKTDLWDRRWGPVPDTLPTRGKVITSLDNLKTRDAVRRRIQEAAKREGKTREETTRQIIEAQKKIDAEPGSWREVSASWNTLVGTQRRVCTPKPAGELILHSPGVQLTGRYNETLDLYTAALKQEATTSAGVQIIRSFINAAGHCLAVKVSGPAASRLKRITLFRRPDTTGGPAGDAFPVQWEDLPPRFHALSRNTIAIRQRFPWGGAYQERFESVMAATVSGAAYHTETDATAAHIVLDKAPDAAGITVYLTVLSSRDAKATGDRLLKKAADRLASTEKAGFDALLKSHRKWWSDFWKRGMVFLPDKVIEQAWYLLFYQLACEARAGKQAPGLCGLWTPNNTTPWGGDYHLDQNEQMMFWGCFTSNRMELVKPYLALLESWVPRAKWRAKEVYQCEGIRWPLASDAEGNERTLLNYAYEQWCQAAAASHFWFYFQHTRDRAWLKKTGYPVLKESMRFYETYLHRDDNGSLCIYPSIPPETRRWSKNPTADLAVIRLLLNSCINAASVLNVDPDKQELWKQMRTDLSAYPLYVPDKTRPERRVLGFSETAPWLFVVHPTVLAPIFPGNDIGLDSPEDRLRLGRNTLRALLDRRDENGAITRSVVCNITHGRGWMCIAAARLGMKDVILPLLKHWITTFFQHNGLTSAWDSRFVQMEPIATDCQNVSTAVGEMLLQSYNGRIRLFPACPDAWQDAAFARFSAAGGFVVSAERRAGKTAYAIIESRAGRPCTLVNPEPGRPLVIVKEGADKTAIVSRTDKPSVTFTTEAGARYSALFGTDSLNDIPPVFKTGKPAASPRAIGRDKHFGLPPRGEGKPFAGSTCGKVINIESINDGIIQEKKRWPGAVVYPAENVCRIEPLFLETDFQAHFGIAYEKPRTVSRIKVYAASGYSSVFGGRNLLFLPKASVCHYFDNDQWVAIPGTRTDNATDFPLVHDFEPVTTTKLRFVILKPGTARLRKPGQREVKEYRNAAVLELIAE